MEMVLETLHLGAWAVLIEQTNGIGDEIIVIWSFVLQDKLVLAAFLVVLQLFFWINFSITELESCVFEGLQDWHTSFQVDWSLLDAITDGTLLFLLEQVVVSCKPVVLSKFTWPLI